MAFSKVIIMSENNQSMCSPLSKAKGLGSSKSGTAHWVAQRLTAILLIPLFFYFLVNVDSLTSKNYLELVEWFQTPVNSIAMVLFVICAFYHGMLGLEEVITDYVHSYGVKVAALILNKTAFLLLAATSIYSILAISFGVL